MTHYPQHQPKKQPYFCKAYGCHEVVNVENEYCPKCEAQLIEYNRRPTVKLSKPDLGFFRHNETDEEYTQRNTRANRVLCDKVRKRLLHIAHYPSSSVAFLTENGRATQKTMVQDVCLFMAAMVNELDFNSRKVGIGTKKGFLLRSWKYIEEYIDLPDWRRKQLQAYATKKGWISSVQPRESYTGADNREKWRGLASIKRVEMQFFDDLGLLDDYEKAKNAARKNLKEKAKGWKIAVKYIMTPITLLARRRKEAAERKTQRIPYPKNFDPIPI